MRADFTRLTFDPAKHYSGVRQQQGRVQLDADWNEQVDIEAHLRRRALADLIGPSGAPHGRPGDFANFQVQAAGPDLQIAPGHMYVDGVLCQNEAIATTASQPHLVPNSPTVVRADGGLAALPAPAGTYLAYLDVWERGLTALEDPSIRESALGGPDTAARTQTIWQVRLLAVGDASATLNCLSTIAAWDALVAPTSAQLQARAEPTEDAETPCTLPPGGGFRRLENQLYRVEIHDPGPAGTATFKWSRENGSIATEWVGQDRNDLVVASLGRDAALGFAPGQWVELTDDSRELLGRPGVLVQLAAAQGQILTLNPDTAPVPIDRANFPVNPKVRRWDMPASATGPLVVETPAANDGYLALEDGVEVRFDPAATDFRSGDYWLIPARTLTADVEWPRSGDAPAPRPPSGTEHRFCRLALVRADEGGNLTVLSDCRPLFPAVTELTSCYYVGGDGQEGLPQPLVSPGSLLTRPLQVGVANGQWPVLGATVRFAAALGNGQLESLDGSVVGAALDVPTGPDGVAACRWRLDGAAPTQEVVATLLDAGGTALQLPIRFGATLSVASQVGYSPGGACTNLVGITNVQDAIDELCKTGNNVEGIHIRDVRTVQPDVSLPNDAPLTAPLLAQGLRIVCDGNVSSTSLVGKPTCFVTLEMPFPFNATDRQLWGSPVLGFQPLIVRGQVSVENGSNIVWRPADQSVAGWLTDTLFARMADQQRGDRILGHLTLRGNFIWGADRRTLYLDGESFGIAAGSGVTALDLPSGDGRRGGEFELWFWLTPEAAGLRTLTIDPAAVTGGGQATGTVTLSGRAPANGTSVRLTSNNPAATVPASVTVPPGQFSATFPVTTTPVATAQTITITAHVDGSPDQTFTFTVQPPRLLSLTLANTQTGGQTVGGTLTLNGAAPTGGIDVALASSSAGVATVPATQRVGAGQTQASFTATVAGPGQTTITGTLGDVRSATLQVLPRLASLSLSTTAVVVGQSVVATVAINRAVPFDVTITLSSTNANVALPPVFVIMPAGQTATTFAVASRALGLAAIAAALTGSAAQSDALRVLPVMAALNLIPTSLQGGDDGTGNVVLASPLPFAITVGLVSGNPSFASVPGSITMFPGQTVAGFGISTAFTTVQRTVSIRAFYADIAPPFEGQSQRTSTLTIVRSKLKDDDKLLKEKEFDGKLIAEFSTKVSDFVNPVGPVVGPLVNPVGPFLAPRPGAGPAGPAARAFIRPDERPATQPAAGPGGAGGGGSAGAGGGSPSVGAAGGSPSAAGSSGAASGRSGRPASPDADGGPSSAATPSGSPSTGAPAAPRRPTVVTPAASAPPTSAVAPADATPQGGATSAAGATVEPTVVVPPPSLPTAPGSGVQTDTPVAPPGPNAPSPRPRPRGGGGRRAGRASEAGEASGGAGPASTEARPAGGQGGGAAAAAGPAPTARRSARGTGGGGRRSARGAAAGAEPSAGSTGPGAGASPGGTAGGQAGGAGGGQPGGAGGGQPGGAQTTGSRPAARRSGRASSSGERRSGGGQTGGGSAGSGGGASEGGPGGQSGGSSGRPSRPSRARRGDDDRPASG